MKKIYFIPLFSFFLFGCTTVQFYHEVERTEPESGISRFIWHTELSIVEFDGEEVSWGHGVEGLSRPKIVNCKPGTHTITANYFGSSRRAEGLELTYDFAPGGKYVINDTLVPNPFGYSVGMEILEVGIGYNQNYLKYFE